jgi:hypothetical protein
MASVPRLTPDQKALIVNEYAAGETSRVIGARHGVWWSTVLYIVRAAGIEIRRPNADLPCGKKRCPMCHKAKDRLKAFYNFKPGSRLKTSIYCRDCVSNSSTIKTWAKRARLRSQERWRREMAAAYGGACSCCGETKWEFLTLDHVRGKGHQERKRLGRKGVDFYRHLKRQGWPQDDYRLLCFNCNLASGFYGSCPHAGPVVIRDGLLEGRAAATRKAKRRLRQKAVAGYGGRCECCGESEPMFLAFDHLHGGGCQERRTFGVYQLLLRLQREGWPRGEIRLLCHNCNSCLGKLGYCPHRN